MTCSWCGKKIPLFRSFTDSEYCSVAHREQEEKSMRQLAIDRLRQSIASDREFANA
jgi:hypothetical protein